MDQERIEELRSQYSNYDEAKDGRYTGVPVSDLKQLLAMAEMYIIWRDGKPAESIVMKDDRVL